MNILNLAQIIVSIAIIILILLQERQSGGGALFGGGGDGTFYQTRRGLEKILFVGTLVLIGAFALLAILSLIL